MVTKQWAHEYCDKILAQYRIDFPFTITRYKQGGYEDASARITDEKSFYEAYKLFDLHPRCARIMLYHDSLPKPVSI